MKPGWAAAFAIDRRSILLASAAALLPFPAAASGTVNVLYAGSLVNMMEHGVGSAFDKAAGDTFQGYAGGSKGLANQIKGKLRRGDVFLSASPKVNDSLMGQQNGAWVSWYIQFASSPLVIGYNSHSKFAAQLKAKPWQQALTEPGIRIGRTDPKLDPKGALTIELLKNAGQFYHQSDLSQKILGRPENPAQILPEETLVGRLQSGELDVGFFYSTETAAAHIPSISLPPEITPKAQYTITILRDAANPAGAAQFITFLLGPDGRRLLQRSGLNLLPLTIHGDAEDVPQALQSLATITK